MLLNELNETKNVHFSATFTFPGNENLFTLLLCDIH